MQPNPTIMPDAHPHAEHRYLYIDHVEAHPSIPLKGKANKYTSHNGHMFSCINKDSDVGVRLGKEEREAFLAEHGTELLVSYNTVMKEYVVVPESILHDRAAFHALLDQGFAYVDGLKPK